MFQRRCGILRVLESEDEESQNDDSDSDELEEEV